MKYYFLCFFTFLVTAMLFACEKTSAPAPAAPKAPSLFTITHYTGHGEPVVYEATSYDYGYQSAYISFVEKNSGKGYRIYGNFEVRQDK